MQHAQIYICHTARTWHSTLKLKLQRDFSGKILQSPNILSIAFQTTCWQHECGWTEQGVLSFWATRLPELPNSASCASVTSRWEKTAALWLIKAEAISRKLFSFLARLSHTRSLSCGLARTKRRRLVRLIGDGRETVVHRSSWKIWDISPLGRCKKCMQLCKKRIYRCMQHECLKVLLLFYCEHEIRCMN